MRAPLHVTRFLGLLLALLLSGCPDEKPRPVPSIQVGDEVVYSQGYYPRAKVRLKVIERVGTSLKVKATLTLRGQESHSEFTIPSGSVASLPQLTERPSPNAPVETIRHLGRDWKCTVSRNTNGPRQAICSERPLGLCGGLLFEDRRWTLESYVVGWDAPPEGERTVEAPNLVEELGSRASHRAPPPRNFGRNDPSD